MKNILIILCALSSSYLFSQVTDWSWDSEKIQKALSDTSSNLDLVDKNGMTALLKTTSSGLSNISLEIIKSKRANINAKTTLGTTPLMFASQKGSLRTVEALIQAKADLNIQELGGSTALSYALLSDNIGIFQALIKAKANLDQVDVDGNTVLITSIFIGKTNFAELLVKGGADLNIKDSFGHKAVMYATNEDMVKLLGGRDDQTKMIDELFKNNRVLIKDSFDYSSLWPKAADKYSDALIFGEYHGDTGDFEDLVGRIAEASNKNKIMTAFATEFVHSNEQAMMSVYQKLNIPTEIMSKRIRLGDKMNSLLDKINKLGIPIIGLDIPIVQPSMPSYDDKQAIEKLEIMYINLINAKGMDERNTLWVDIISKEFAKAPASKILVYCGAGHSDYAAQTGKPISVRLGNKGYTVSVIRATLEPENIEHSNPDHIAATARRLNMDKEKFVVFVPKDKAKIMGADIFIHLPAKKTEEDNLFRYKSDGPMSTRGSK